VREKGAKSGEKNREKEKLCYREKTENEYAHDFLIGDFSVSEFS
jgi:hypothetical protein